VGQAGRHKIIVAVAASYLVALFVSTHIPIPKLVYEAGVSDKWLHFLAYMNLFFLMWFSFYPDKQVNWRQPAIWLIFLGGLILGGVDELTQPFTGRTCDVLDFIADAKGVSAGMVIVAFLPFWPALLAVWAITIFGIATLVSADPSKIAPILDTVYHITAYGGLTFVWAHLINFYLSPRTIINRLLLYTSLPLGFILFVKVSSVVMGRYFTGMEMLFSGGAILAAAAARCLIEKR
jgi:VanZ family protein